MIGRATREKLLLQKVFLQIEVMQNQRGIFASWMEVFAIYKTLGVRSVEKGIPLEDHSMGRWPLLLIVQLCETGLEMYAMHLRETPMRQGELLMMRMLLREALLDISVQILPPWGVCVAVQVT